VKLEENKTNGSNRSDCYDGILELKNSGVARICCEEGQSWLTSGTGATAA